MDECVVIVQLLLALFSTRPLKSWVPIVETVEMIAFPPYHRPSAVARPPPSHRSYLASPGFTPPRVSFAAAVRIMGIVKEISRPFVITVSQEMVLEI